MLNFGQKLPNSQKNLIHSLHLRISVRSRFLEPPSRDDFFIERQWTSLVSSDRFGLKSFTGLTKLSIELAYYSDAFLRSKDIDPRHSERKHRSGVPPWDDEACGAPPERVPVLMFLHKLSLLPLKSLHLRFLQRDTRGWSDVGREIIGDEAFELVNLAGDMMLNEEIKNSKEEEGMA